VFRSSFLSSESSLAFLLRCVVNFKWRSGPSQYAAKMKRILCLFFVVRTLDRQRKNFFIFALLQKHWRRPWSRGGTGSGVPDSTPAGFCVFLSDQDPGPESNICEKPDPSAVAGVCVVNFLSKTWVDYGWIDDLAGVWTGVEFSNLKNRRIRTRIQKFWNRSGFGVWESDSGHFCLEARSSAHVLSNAKARPVAKLHEVLFS